jgi:hypothetical protein
MVCGSVHEFAELGSTMTNGWPDLDLRPAPLQRGTMEMWVKECPSCGYCAPNLEKGLDSVASIVRSGEYQEVRSTSAIPRLAVRFSCRAYIAGKCNDPAGAGFASLHAAWTCDDVGNIIGSETCRSLAIGFFSAARKHGTRFSNDAGVEEAILCDLYRRTGRFRDALAMANLGLEVPPVANIARVLTYQISLIETRDTATHSMDEVLEKK